MLFTGRVVTSSLVSAMLCFHGPTVEPQRLVVLTDTTVSYPSVLLDCVAALLGERSATERMNIDKALTSID